MHLINNQFNTGHAFSAPGKKYVNDYIYTKWKTLSFAC